MSNPFRFRARRCLLTGLLVALIALPSAGQDAYVPASDEPIPLTLDEAVEIALERNYALRTARLNIETADAQVRQAVSGALPSVDFSSSYTRNLVAANPFAGSSAGDFFSGLGAIDWLAFNEEARTDDDPGTLPISLTEFRRRQSQGLEDAGIVLDTNANPFAVDNVFLSGITVSQTLYDQAVLLAVRGARELRASSRAAYERQEQLVVDQTRQAYYRALLAQDQLDVVRSSVARTAATLGETSKRVTQGVASKYQRLSAEVELSNLETQMIQSENQFELSLNALKLTLGLPIDRPIRLQGSLRGAYEERPLVRRAALRDAVTEAIRQRPDLQQAEIAISLQELQRKAEQAGYIPRLSAFANFNYSGRVPDARTSAVQSPDDPFSYTEQSRGFFADPYWNADVAVGVSLTWNLFDGFNRRARIQQQAINIRQREVEMEQLYQNVLGEVEQALLNLQAAERRIAAQARNVDRARVNYEFASTRLREGVSSALEERQASELLDQSQVGYLQAVHDYLVALSSYDAALGVPVSRTDDSLMTTR